jgi:hypothetical protein
LNLPNKNNPKIIIEEEKVEQVRVEDFGREALIRDLKNTRIELPERFRMKKSEEPKATREIPREGNGPVQKTEQQQEDSQEEEEISAVPSSCGRMEGQEQRYFIRHIVLF